MSEREELEAVKMLASELFIDQYSANPDWETAKDMAENFDTDAFVEKIATALISSGYTKGNGELVEAVRELCAACQHVDYQLADGGVTESAHSRLAAAEERALKALSDSEGMATSGGDAGRWSWTASYRPYSSGGVQEAISLLVAEARDQSRSLRRARRTCAWYEAEHPSHKKGHALNCSTWWSYSHTLKFRALWKKEALLKAARMLRPKAALTPFQKG